MSVHFLFLNAEAFWLVYSVISWDLEQGQIVKDKIYLINCLPCVQEDLSLIPSPCILESHYGVLACNAGAEEAQTGGSLWRAVQLLEKKWSACLCSAHCFLEENLSIQTQKTVLLPTFTLEFPTAINAIQAPTPRHSHRSNQSTHFITEIPFQVILDCVKLKMKISHCKE